MNIFQVIGPIDKPTYLKYPDLKGGGLLLFVSNIIRLITIIAGLWGFINLILAGFGFVSSQGDPEKTNKAQGKIWNSLIGLIIIVSSYTLAAILGKILFGSFDAILKPTIYGPSGAI